MTSNEYVMNVVRNHALPAQLDTNTVYYVVNPLKRVIANGLAVAFVRRNCQAQEPKEPLLICRRILICLFRLHLTLQTH